MYKLIKDDVCDRSGVRRLTYVCDSTEDLYFIGRAPAGSTAFVPSVNAVYTMSPSGTWVFTPDTEWALAEQSDTKPKQALSKRLSANLSAFTITKAGEEITTGASLVTGDTLTITVEPNAGYEALCLANGAVLGVSNTSETYTYVVEPGKQVTITAAAAADKAFDLIFRETNCTISVTGPDGEILPGENMILSGTTITITTEADPDHAMSTLTVNGNAFTSGNTLVVNRDVTVEALALELFDITITTDGHCDVIVNGGEYTDGSTAADGTLMSIEAAAHEGYTLEENPITVNGNPYTEPFTVIGDIAIVATAVLDVVPLVGEIDFKTDSTWNSENEMYVVDAPPTIDFSGLTDGDVNIKITYTIDGNPTTAIGTKASSEDFLYISSLFSADGIIDLGGGLSIGVLEGLGENADMVYLIAPENYLLTHTVVLNSIEIDENITEILSADIDYAYDNTDTYDGTITTQTIDTTGLINEQSNIKTYWDIDGTRYIVNAMAIITGTTTSFQQNIVTDTLTITTGVLAKIIDTDGVITTEITGLAGTEVVTLLSIFVDENV